MSSNPNLTEIITPEWFINNDNYTTDNRNDIQKLTEYINAFYEIYPNGDLQAEKYDGYYVPTFVIKFDRFTITNGELSHTITDLLVKFKIRIRNSGETFIYNIDEIEGIRLSLFDIEIDNSYGHSHLPSRSYTSNDIDYAEFCLGESSLSISQMMFNSSDNIDNFKLFLFNIKEYVKWESIDGGPFIMIKELVQKNEQINININKVDFESIYNIIDSTITTDSFNLLGGSNITIKDDTVFNKYLLSVLPNEYKTHVINDIEYEIVHTDSFPSQYEDKKCDIIFKRKRITDIEINNYLPNQNDINDMDIRIISKIKDRIIKRLNKKLKYTILYEKSHN
jgi:hypothetical protein